MKKLKIGVLGCANIAKRSVIPAIKSLDQYELIAVASRKLEKAQELASTFNCIAIGGYNKLLQLDNIDAVYIPLPTGMHYEWIKKSLEHNKHVLCEKSFVVNFEEAQSLISIAKDKNLLIAENFMFPFHSQNNYVKELVLNNEIGELRNFRSSFGFPPFKDKNNIRYQKELGGGALLDAGAYPVKACQMILGNDLSVLSSHLQIDKATNVDLWGSALLLCKEHNITCSISFGFDNFYQCNYEIWGSTGKITVHRSFTAGPGFQPRITIEKQGIQTHKILATDNHFNNLLLSFYMTINEGNFTDNYNELLIQSKLLTQIRENA